MSNLKIYRTLHDVFISGLEENVSFFRLEDSLVYNGCKFKKGQLFYIPGRAYVTSNNKRPKEFVVIYTYPQGDLLNLPWNLKGNFVKYQENDAVDSQHNDPAFQIQIKNQQHQIQEIGQQDGNNKATNHQRECSVNFGSGDDNSNNCKQSTQSPQNGQPTNPGHDFDQTSILRNSANNASNIGETLIKSNDESNDVLNSNCTTLHNQNAKQNCSTKKSKQNTNTGRYEGNAYENHLLPLPNKSKPSSASHSNVPDPLSPENKIHRQLPPRELPKYKDDVTLQENNSSKPKIKSFNNGLKIRTSRTASRHFDGTEYKQMDTSGERATESTDKRCSIFTDKEYVSMSTLQKFEFFLQHCNSTGRDRNKDVGDEDNQRDYLDMSHPLFSFQQQSQSQRTSDPIHRSNSTVRNCITRNSNSTPPVLNSGIKCKSVEDILRIDDSSNSNNNKSPKKTKKIASTISSYQRLMNEVVQNFDSSSILRYNESSLADDLDFNKFESRLIYYSTRGWLPNELPPSIYWKEKFPDDFSVEELHLFISSFGNQRLADYLKTYHVDGYFMKLLIKDDLLLDDTLFDESWITRKQLEAIRSKYHPKRPRCFAVDSSKLNNSLVEAI